MTINIRFLSYRVLNDLHPRFVADGIWNALVSHLYSQSCPSLFLMAGSTGTNVNSAVTLQEINVLLFFKPDVLDLFYKIFGISNVMQGLSTISALIMIARSLATQRT